MLLHRLPRAWNGCPSGGSPAVHCAGVARNFFDLYDIFMVAYIGAALHRGTGSRARSGCRWKNWRTGAVPVPLLGLECLDHSGLPGRPPVDERREGEPLDSVVVKMSWLTA